MSDVDRIVIGAGISGLLAARRAVARGEHVLVLERDKNAGGLIQSTQCGTLTLDAGAEAFSTAGESCFRLIDELGLTESIVSPARSDARIVYSDTQQYRIPHGVLGIPSSLDDPELESIITPSALEQARMLDSSAVGDYSNLTVAQLVEDRLGVEFLEKLVDPLFLGVHGSSARQLHADATIPQLVKAMHEAGSLCAGAARLRKSQPRPGAAVASIKGGLFQLTTALCDDLQSRAVRCEFAAEVNSIEPTTRGWSVRTSHSEYTSRTLTVSTGVGHAQALLGGLVESPLPQVRTGTIDVTLVILEVDSVQLTEFPLGSGALISPGHSAQAKATTHVNAKWAWVHNGLPANRHIIRLSYGRDGVIPDGNLIETAARDIKLLYGIDDAVILSAREVPWPDSLFQASLGSRELVTTLARVAAQNDIELCGSFVSGNGLLGIIRDHYQRTAL